MEAFDSKITKNSKFGIAPSNFNFFDSVLFRISGIIKKTTQSFSSVYFRSICYRIKCINNEIKELLKIRSQMLHILTHCCISTYQGMADVSESNICSNKRLYMCIPARACEVNTTPKEIIKKRSAPNGGGE